MIKARYYLYHGFITLLPKFLMRWYGNKQLADLPEQQKIELQDRVNYYCKLNQPCSLDSQTSTKIASFKQTGGSTYYFDLYKVVKCFSPEKQFHYINGDVIEVPKHPSFVKSRPINEDNSNSVLLKLNAIRHYQFANDTLDYRNKKDDVVWRGTGFRPNRRLLLDKYFHHPRCNVGRTDTKKGEQPEFVVPRMSIEEQLQYKFILSLEGKDVATNLKWIMSSNSLCITPKLRYETWFMEGRLEAGVHYVEIKDDFSDLIEKMDYYLANPQEAEKIIKNAQAWVEQFLDPKQEKLISLLVAKKYFKLSGQSGV
ncbi:glycosyltransferase [Vibrio sp. AK197]